MKSKLVFKTILLTLGVIIVLAISAFGIASLLAPAAMMDFTSKIGLVSISGDYAYREYERSGDISCLARSFVISADNKADRTAETRFEALYADEEFDAFCKAQDEGGTGYDFLEGYTCRAYLCGLAAQVRYRLSKTDEENSAVLEFAFAETDASFPRGNPVIMLSVEAASRHDGAFCSLLLGGLGEQNFTENEDYRNIVKILEDNSNE